MCNSSAVKIDADFYIEVLSSFKENTWFQATNKQREEYSICEMLHSAGIIQQMKTPVWQNGSFTGFKVWFRYNVHLQYQL